MIMLCSENTLKFIQQLKNIFLKQIKSILKCMFKNIIDKYLNVTRSNNSIINVFPKVILN